MTSLDRQWRDHVNEGAVVRWLRRAWKRWQQRVVLRSRYILAVGVRVHGLPGGPMRMLLSREIAPEIDTVFDQAMFLPVALRGDEEIVVVLEDVHLRTMRI